MNPLFTPGCPASCPIAAKKSMNTSVLESRSLRMPGVEERVHFLLLWGLLVFSFFLSFLSFLFPNRRREEILTKCEMLYGSDDYNYRKARKHASQRCTTTPRPLSACTARSSSSSCGISGSDTLSALLLSLHRLFLVLLLRPCRELSREGGQTEKEEDKGKGEEEGRILVICAPCSWTRSSLRICRCILGGSASLGR